MTTTILEPQYTTRAEAAPVVKRALRNYGQAKRTTLQVMADLRTLQDRGAHILYGEQNFATWVEQTFDGLNASNVKQLTRSGGVLLELDKRKLIDIYGVKAKPAPVGVRGLRALSVVANTYGDDKMAEVFVTALGMVEDRDVSERTVQAAMQLLMPAAATDLEVPEALEVGEGGESEEELTEPIDDGLPAATKERVQHIQDLSWDLPETAGELALEAVALEKELRGEELTEDERWLGSGR